jgi:hypothetical protein
MLRFNFGCVLLKAVLRTIHLSGETHILFLIFKHLNKISKIQSLRIYIKSSEGKSTSEKN